MGGPDGRDDVDGSQWAERLREQWRGSLRSGCDEMRIGSGGGVMGGKKVDVCGTRVSGRTLFGRVRVVMAG